LRHGVATDAASLSDACLGIGAAGQPDPVGHIQADCDAKVGGAILSRCTGVDLGDAFSTCFATNPNDATDCLKRESACQLCLMVNDVDQLSRDCDLLDDGNAANGSCGSECPDGIVQQDESCDDGNATDNDGCSDHCTIEGGWACTGEPSTCTRKCGDGALDAGESCDDANLTNGDGCNNACDVENGYECSGAPSVCQKKCGNGTVDVTNGEVCDDDNNANGDGCSSTCQVEDGFNCAGTAPSVCTFVCGNGTFQTGETCDDNNAANNDGCSHTCKIEPGWLCAGIPSVCAPKCGDGLKRGTEPATTTTS
jgi:cysteine-rich repeat protein